MGKKDWFNHWLLWIILGAVAILVIVHDDGEGAEGGPASLSGQKE